MLYISRTLSIFYELIAIIITTSWCVVFFPRSRAYPTKVCATYFARHVIASLALLDRSLTLFIRAHFCISHYPIEIFTFTRVFGFPLFKHITISWPMLLLSTFKAKWISAETIYYISVWGIWNSFNCIFTFFTVWAPSNISIIICEWFTMPSQVLF